MGKNEEQSNFRPLLNRDCSTDSKEADQELLKTCQMFTNLKKIFHKTFILQGGSGRVKNYQTKHFRQ